VYLFEAEIGGDQGLVTARQLENGAIIADSAGRYPVGTHYFTQPADQLCLWQRQLSTVLRPSNIAERLTGDSFAPSGRFKSDKTLMKASRTTLAALALKC